MITFSAELKIFLYNDAIDMRAGFERLSFLIVTQLNRKLERGNLFLFLGKNRRRLKCLYHDGSGLVMACKRLETGRFMFVKEAFALGEITCSDLNLILHGSTIRRENSLGSSKKLSDTMGMLRLPEGQCL